MRDIRELSGDPEAYAAELERRWTEVDAVTAPEGTVGVRVTLYDEGADNRAITAASAVLRMVE